MKIKNIFTYLVLFAAIFSSCREEVPAYEQQTDTKEWPMIYLGKAAKQPEVLPILPFADSKTTTINASYGGVGLPSSDINVTLAVDSKALDSINKARVANGASKYELFPTNSTESKFELLASRS